MLELKFKRLSFPKCSILHYSTNRGVCGTVESLKSAKIGGFEITDLNNLGMLASFKFIEACKEFNNLAKKGTCQVTSKNIRGVAKEIASFIERGEFEEWDIEYSTNIPNSFRYSYIK